MSTYRQLWQGRWADHADQLRHMVGTAEGLSEQLKTAVDWHEELAAELDAVLLELAERGVSSGAVVDMLVGVREQLVLEASTDGQAWSDLLTCDYLTETLGQLEQDAGAWGAGHDHF